MFPILASDERLFFVLNALVGRSKIFDGLAVFFASYFPYLLVAALLALVYFSAYSRREKIFLLWVPILSAVVARLGVVELIRFFYHRPRPFVSHSVHQLLSDNEWSFPSGHAAFFFAMATTVYLCNKKWGVGFFIGAVVVTVSRVIAGVHYPSDILGGMVIGAAVAYAVFSIAEKWRTKEKEIA